MEALKTYNSVLEAIGRTPLIRLNKIAEDIPATIYAKVEGFNPGLSAKDRIALYMIEKAEREGKLQAGGTIIEATSGNTGYSIAMISSIKGYKCILTLSAKASKEKIQSLKALGAEVIVCPTNVTAEDPRSYYSVAERLAQEIENSYYLNQNYDQANLEAHYHTTGPEIWQQTKGKVTHYVACAGTGGTISGTARFLKEQNPDVQVIGVDAYGSVLAKYHETGEFDPNEIFSYKVEGLGKSIIPSNVDFGIIDRFIKVNDKDSALCARRLASEEGLMVGYSSGSAMQAVLDLAPQLTEDDIVVVLFSDHGSKYLGKIFNDEWMRNQGFLPAETVETPQLKIEGDKKRTA